MSGDIEGVRLQLDLAVVKAFAAERDTIILDRQLPGLKASVANVLADHSRLLERVGELEKEGDRLRREILSEAFPRVTVDKLMAVYRAANTQASASGKAEGAAQVESAWSREELGCDYCRDGNHWPAGTDYWKCPRCDAEWHGDDERTPSSNTEG